jgi:hypothetical protein
MNGLLLALAVQSHWGHRHKHRRCSWKGHCIGATCVDENDCSDDLICIKKKCAKWYPGWYTNSTVATETSVATETWIATESESVATESEAVGTESEIATESESLASETEIATESVASEALGSESEAAGTETSVESETWEPSSTEASVATEAEETFFLGGCTWTSSTCYIPKDCI